MMKEVMAVGEGAGSIVQAGNVIDTLALTPLDITTLGAGACGVLAIMMGSKEYTRIQGKPDSVQIDQQVARKASTLILSGTVAMAVTTVLAGNPRYMVPEGFACLTSFKTWLESHYPTACEHVKKTLEKTGVTLRSDLVTTVAFVGIMGGLVLHGDIQNVQQALFPVGLSLLGIAFSMTPDTPLKNKIYRALTILGGGTLVVGSGTDLAVSDTTTGQIMSGSFLTLNIFYTYGELKNLLGKKKEKQKKTL